MMITLIFIRGAGHSKKGWNTLHGNLLEMFENIMHCLEIIGNENVWDAIFSWNPPYILSRLKIWIKYEVALKISFQSKIIKTVEWCSNSKGQQILKIKIVFLFSFNCNYLTSLTRKITIQITIPRNRFSQEALIHRNFSKNSWFLVNPYCIV